MAFHVSATIQTKVVAVVVYVYTYTLERHLRCVAPAAMQWVFLHSSHKKWYDLRNFIFFLKFILSNLLFTRKMYSEQNKYFFDIAAGDVNWSKMALYLSWTIQTESCCMCVYLYNRKTFALWGSCSYRSKSSGYFVTWSLKFDWKNTYYFWEKRKQNHLSKNVR